MDRLFKTARLTMLVMAVGCIWPFQLAAQKTEKDSFLLLVEKYRTQPEFEKDTNYISALNDLAFRYNNINPDTTILLSKQAIDLCNRIHYFRGKADALKNTGLAYNVKGDYVNALKNHAEALQTALACGYTKGAGRIYHNTGIVYSNLGKYPESLDNYYQALRMREAIADTLGISSSTNGIGTIFFMQGKYADALAYYQKALWLAQQINYTSGIESGYANIGEVYFRQGNYSDAEKNLLESLKLTAITGNKETKAFISYILASINLKQGDYNRAIDNFMESKRLASEIGSQEYEIRSRYGVSEADIALNKLSSALQRTSEGMDIAKQIGFNELLREGHEIMSRIYEKQNNPVKALFHFKQFKLFADSINNQQTEQRAQNLAADYEYSKKEILLKAEQEKKEIAFQKKTSQQRWIIFSVLAALFSALIVASLIYRSRQKEKRSNLLLHRKNIEIDNQKTAVEKALTELKATQQQLIQSEKMASLGELTAGIAHEIQNPLNFVNNFSEVNMELLDEMKQELNAGHYENATAIAADVIYNQGKINEHGKRADAIVKNMLQHSQTSTGQKEPTAINTLCDEYLRLAYHGLKAKDKLLNISVKTDFDENTGNINIVPQDIGRVLLNLFNNAFYAAPLPPKGGFKNPGYKHEPTVWVTTKKEGNKVLISVRDNGPGIAAEILDKIFQPFFTTKPTGQGTGLGLSLSYDIVKAHGGELKVKTKAGEGLPAGEAGSEFIISLPVN